MKELIRSKQRKQGTVKLAGAFGLLLALSLIVALVATPAMALFPQLPNRFFGEVTYEPSGSYVEAGARVSAEVYDPVLEDWVEVASTLVVLIDDIAWYDFNVPPDDDETPAKDGGEPDDEIRFYVDGILAGTWGDDPEEPGWESGGSDRFDLEVFGVFYDLTVTSDGCCPITVEGLGEVAANSSDTFVVAEGSDVTVTADDSDACCQFDSWSDAGAKSHTVHMDGNKSVTAYCSEPTYDLTVTSVGCCPIDVAYDMFSDQVAAGGSETFTGIPCCTDVTVTADDSNPSCEFDSWSDAGAKSHIIHMDSNKSVTAYCSIPGPTYELTVTSEGCCPITVEGLGEVDANSTGTFQVPVDTDVTITADDSDACCEFDSWSDAGDKSHSVHMDGNKSVTAYCSVPTYDLTVTSDGCCPIDVAYDMFSDQVAAGGSQTFTGIPCDTDVTVTADDSDACCQFDSWSDAGAKSHTVHMDGNKSVTAYCSEPTYDLTVTSDGCCPIDVAYDMFSDQVAAGGSETFTGIPCDTDVTVTADDSAACCQFDSWSDAGAKSHSVHMDDDKSITAYCTVADVLEEVPLSAGWNTFSTPIVLHPCSDTWDELVALSGLAGDVEAVYYYDSYAGYWDPVYTGHHDEVTPLKGFYVKLKDESLEPTVVIIPYWDNPEPSIPPCKTLSDGLNFIGNTALVDQDVFTALIDIYEVGGHMGYSKVYNPAENVPNDWPPPPNNFYVRDSTPVPTMESFKAYWVKMAILGGELCGCLPPTP